MSSMLEAMAALIAIAPLSTATNNEVRGDCERCSRISVLVENHADDGYEVVVFDERDRGFMLSPENLSGITLRDLDYAARTKLEEFLPDRPRRRNDDGDMHRLILPNDGGVLYSYVREVPQALEYGLMHIAPSGQAHCVLSLSGTGDGSSEVPFLDTVAVSRDGRDILVATTQSAGGDLIHVDLTTRRAFTLTETAPVQTFNSHGLALGAGWGVGVSENGVFRFALHSGEQATLVSFEGTSPAWYAREAVLSENGQYLVTVAGDAPAQAYPFVLGSSGSAIKMNDTPGNIRGAGFLPDSLDGPFLAVSNDGQDCAWVAIEGNSRELYSSTRGASSTSSSFHLTRDQQFHPYLDEVGLLSFKFGRLHFSAGDRRDPVLGGITLASYYRAENGAPGTEPSVVDMARTYENAGPPFLEYSALNPVQVNLTPSGESYIVRSQVNERTEMFAVRMTGHTGQMFQLLSNVDDIFMLEFAGEKALLSVGLEEDSVENRVYEFPVGLDELPSQLIQLDEEGIGARTTKSSGEASFVSPDEYGPEKLWRINSDGVPPDSLSLLRGEFGKTLAITPRGSLAFTTSSPSGSGSLFVWGTGRFPRHLTTSAGDIRILPAN